MFNSESINGEECSEKGKFKIIGSVNDEIKTENELLIDLTYPPNNYAKCIIPKSPIGQIEINCVIAYPFSGEPIIIEQQILRDDDLNELLTLKSVKSNEKINCVEGDEISENISTEENTTIINDEISENITTEENTTIINDEISENITTEENTTILDDERKYYYIR